MSTAYLFVCTYPTKSGPCGRKPVVIYQVGGAPYPRCRKHDGASVRALAEEKGYARQEIAA